MICLSCSNSEQRKIKEAESNAWKTHIDSASNYFRKGMICHDSLCLNKALAFLDDVIKNDTVKVQLRQYHLLKSQIYYYQRNYKEYFKELKVYIDMLPDDNIQRLMFLGIFSKQKGEIRDSERYFNRAMFLCDSILEKDEDINTVIAKAEVIYFQSGESKALEFIETNKNIFNQIGNTEQFFIDLKELYEKMDSIISNADMDN
jgi:tetratricopeptide (TPR) repeat protein